MTTLRRIFATPIRNSLATVLTLVLTTADLFGQAAPARSAKPWIDMDRGPYLTASIESALPERGMTPKGLAIRVDPAGLGYVLFDTDLLRYSAGWTGGTLDFRGVDFDGAHRAWPAVVGNQVFGSTMTPGWAKAGRFEDPRTVYPSTDYAPQPATWQRRAYGPLPRDWARYRGLYLHGQRVVLSYDVAGTPVLDSPGWEVGGGIGLFTRTLNVEKSPTDMVIHVLDRPLDGGGVAADDAAPGAKRAARGSAKGSTVLLGKLPIAGDGDAVAVRPIPPATGLVASWGLDEEDGKVVSASAKEYDGEMAGGSRTAGRHGKGLSLKAGDHVRVQRSEAIDLSADFSVTGWIKTTRGGTVFSKAAAGKWSAGGKTIFIEDGSLTFDVGWVGAVRSKRKINDGQWHCVAVTYEATSGAVRCYIDGAPDGAGKLKSVPDPAGSLVRFGITSDNFPRGNGNRLDGVLDEIHLYRRVLTAAEVAGLAPVRSQSAPSLLVAGVGTTPEMTWEVADGSQLRLRIPAAATPARIKILIAPAADRDLNRFTAAARASAAAEDLSALTRGGPPRWSQSLTTAGKLGSGDQAYVVDTLTAPNDNPWKARMRFGGFDFFKDGKTAAICTWDGDVWLVQGIDDKLEKLTWRRIATGMFQPLGLKIVPDDKGREQIYVSCRDQITRLHDLNGDGEIDFYECFNNDHQVTEHFHEFAMGLQTDAEGNLYYAKSGRHALDAVVPQHGTILKVSKNGSRTEVVCNGFRAANGLGIGPNGEFAATDQEGFWTPANRINLAKPGGFYGNLFSYNATNRTAKDGYDPPLCWLPAKLDRSPAEDLWVTSDKWGPLKGSLIHTSYGMGKLFLVPYEHVAGVPQGGVVPFPGVNFPTGVMRARFNPADGQLYACGLVGWSSNTAEPGGFYRVRYTGKPVNLPVKLEVKKDGVQLTFTEPLDKDLAADVENYAVQQWQYQWTQNYGSAFYSVSDPAKKGQDEVKLAGVTLSADRRTVFLQIPGLRPVMQMQIDVNIESADGKPVKVLLHNTINRVPD